MALLKQKYLAMNGNLIIAIQMSQHLQDMASIEIYCRADPSKRLRLSDPHMRERRVKYAFPSGYQVEGLLYCHGGWGGDDGKARVYVSADLHIGYGAQEGRTHVHDVIMSFAASDDEIANYGPDRSAAAPGEPGDGGDIDSGPAAVSLAAAPAPVPAAPAGPGTAPPEALLSYVHLRPWPAVDEARAARAFASFPAEAAPPPFYAALTAQGTPLTRSQMQALALQFRCSRSPFDGQYVADCAQLPGLVQLLPKVADAADTHGADPAALCDAILTLFNVQNANEMQTSLLSADYRGAIVRVWESYFAAVIVADDNAARLAAYTRLLLADHLLRGLFGQAARTAPVSAEELALLRQASILLPPGLFPLPAATAPGSAAAPGIAPCAIGELHLVRHSLLRYEAGDVAHIENVMPGERRELRRCRVHGSDERAEESAASVIDNRAGKDKLLCAFRWLNKVYQASVASQGPRLMVEFVLAQPAAGLRERWGGLGPCALERPVPLARRGIASFAQVTRDNVASLAAAYEARGVTPAPASLRLVAATLRNGEQKALPVPNGYRVHRAVVSYLDGNSDSGSPCILVGREKFTPGDAAAQARTFGEDEEIVLSALERPGAPAAAAVDQLLAHVVIECTPTGNTMDEWRIRTWDTLCDGYRRQCERFAGATGEHALRPGRSPRRWMRAQLRQRCGALLEQGAAAAAGEDTAPPAGMAANLLRLQYIDELFEWNAMSTRFCAADPASSALRQLEAEEDGAFAEFLDADQAGVLVPVASGYEAALLYFLASGQCWPGDPALAPVDVPHMALVQELMHQRAASTAPVEALGAPWEIVVPTTMQVIDEDFRVAPPRPAPAAGR